ncbi:MAG: hypothetical protein JWO83_4103 [Caulobacteraceae bacterium]|nr:hypothetical protein [Caulobacteraceae bacterium]
MSEDKLQFLEGSSSSVDPRESEGSESTRVEQADRGPDGRFLTAVPVTDSPPSNTRESGSAEDRPEARLREDGHVPISALLDEREKRQAEKAQREMLERRIAEMRAQAAPQRELAPTEHLEVALYSQNLRASRRFAEREYGKDTVATVHDWATRRCDEDPFFNQQMRSSDDPYEAAFQAYNREQILRTVRPDDLAAFKAWRAAQAVAAGQTPTHPRDSGGHPTTSHTPVPRSLATASGTGGAGASHVPIGPGLAFVNAINR